MTIKMLIVFIGSGLGGVMRFYSSLWINQQIKDRNLELGLFPWPTIIINFFGCFLMGILLAKIGLNDKNSTAYLAIGTGFLGGFTTASAFSAESLSLISQRQLPLAGFYILGTVFLCLIGVACGYTLFGGKI